ncbi:hypothetical protein [Streptomyces virginiae]
MNFVGTCTHGSKGSRLIMFPTNPDKPQMSEFGDAQGMESIVGWDWSNDTRQLDT